MLLTRDNFRSKVFERDKHKCVFCGLPAVDAHHIMERRLWTEEHEFGGYFLENGVSVCEEHHKACERTDISTEEVRFRANIKKILLPNHLYYDLEYTKWGDICLPNGKRLKGELFFDQSVQKIIKNHLDKYSHIIKYPRTFHAPWSENMNSDDRMHKNMNQFTGKRVIVTLKMDGENTTMYSDYIHARSIDGRHHVSRDWIKKYWSNLSYEIPAEWRVCGENLFAEHSIHYNNLESYFYGFSIWNEKNVCLSWNDTLEWFDLLNIFPVKVIYDGLYDENLIKNLKQNLDWKKDEGYVIRIADSFSYSDFKKYVAKVVRKDHIQTVKHWMHGKQVIPNDLLVKD